ncbi:hypothetical protein L6164_005129 [Bauhinia variegata]|uniref:Uncharacterized protein n=1 Tax=Bauhinia variegata TaxID=167791 RepID=A0ACB9PPG9_BAUVA|nr:hypothetical protein L6164_005129 [Bauhinia variegata]
MYRNKCAACYRQFNRMEHLVEHMRTSFHSGHEPSCGICGKHCRSFESLREHLIGPLPKQECRDVFAYQGCRFCLKVFDSPNARRVHQERCQLSGLDAGLIARFANLGLRDNLSMGRGQQVVALACKMVGGGSDGSLDLCARVCIIDEQENIIFHSYVKPPIPVTNYRYETTGIRPEYLRDAMPTRVVLRKIQDFLCNGEPMWKIRPRAGGKARILVGHGLDHDLESLQIEYRPEMLRDTAKYPPLMKTSKLSNSLKYLTQAYLGYDIQTGIQDPYEDCVATMRLYMRMRSQAHRIEDYPLASDPQNRNNFVSWRQSDLERMTPEQMLEISRSDYYCWCLDSYI